MKFFETLQVAQKGRLLEKGSRKTNGISIKSEKSQSCY